MQFRKLCKNLGNPLRRTSMRRWLLLLLLVSARMNVAGAQQELPASAQDGPMKRLSAHQAPPMPDEQGVYMLGPGIVAPAVVEAQPAAYPEGAVETDAPHVCLEAVVVGADGAATSVKGIFQNESVYDRGAIDAIRKSHFQPGMLKDKPVPVLVHVRVPFVHLKPALPFVMQHYAEQAEGRMQAPGRAPAGPGDVVSPPKPIHMGEAEFSEEARRKKIGGVVVVSFTVNEQGVPTDLWVEKGVGAGLDEKALEAVRKYRFEPATKDGKPVAVKLTVEVSFRLR
jgi:TonB family protein